ncbi:MAG: MBL fold metallo-hydrolase [Endozoicomonas sp.]|uniref:MBL fold metallo-hydrolase n=1 Tax=Endozoicomonas sp. TaxID=1892382 RepID=UPI003D9BEBAD
MISGDTRYDEKIAERAKGADILIHEVISEEGLSKLSPDWQKYHCDSHTRSSDLARLASKAKPRLLILTHVLHYSAPVTSALKEVQAGYEGKVVLANDLDVY